MPSCRRLACLAAVLAATGGTLPAQSSVWKVTHGGTTLYLGGTCHVLRPADFPLPPEFDLAFAAAATVWFETDIGRIAEPATQQLLLQQGLYPEGTTVRSALKPATWDVVEKYLKDSGIPADGFLRFKPWMLTVTIAVIEMQKLGLSLEGVDHHYFEKAKAAGKPVHPLESFEEHIAYVTGLGAGHEDEMVLNTVEDAANMPAAIGEMLAAWKTGDVAQLDRAMLDEVRTKYPSIYAELFVKRNNAWLPVIDRLLKSRETELVLVGAGHLAGKDGLLAALRKRGCKIEQLVAKK